MVACEILTRENITLNELLHDVVLAWGTLPCLTLLVVWQHALMQTVAMQRVWQYTRTFLS